ncbi:MAG: DNA polymerase III subunit delta' [Rhodobacteraceae bacterium]|nr:DNA polymerase III subunit delta' [Paracoccaceae bacterium]
MSDLPEPDRVEGAPHPRETERLFGQAAAEAAFLDAHAAGRLHHAWLLTGPRGVGKATFAWRAARFLLAGEAAAAPGGGDLFGAAPDRPATLDVPPDHPVARRLRALSEPRLFLLRRGPTEKGDSLSAQIRVEDTRGLRGFFQLSAADGGRRAVIVDAADEMNPAAANAILKLLEEPPRGAVMLLVSHQPARLLPTIRSRCRELRLAPLGPADMAAALAQAGVAADDPGRLAELAGGSVGEAIRLANLDGLALYERLVGLFRPRLDRPAAIALAESVAGRGGEARLDLLLGLVSQLLARAARTGLGRPPPEAAPGEAALLARLAPDAGAARTWAEAEAALGARARHGRAVNLDPAALILDMLLSIDQSAAALAAP